MQSSDSNFYGMTAYGGVSNAGTVFRISPSGSLTNLYSFSGSDGAYPVEWLVQGSDGNFYGTTVYGGAIGVGTVFRISPSGSLTSLYSFSIGSDGNNPWGTLVQGSDGYFYGTTLNGGTSSCICGTVFRFSPSGNLTNLHSFSGPDGGSPYSALVRGSDGNFYGTTGWGGTSTNCGGGCGTVFRISPSGSLTSLYSFSGSDGANLAAALIQGSDGYFYGTTAEGGASNAGSVFRIGSSGSLTTLYSFSGSDGANPTARLVQGSDGNFYGTTLYGGVSGHGTVFRISPSGSFTNLHSFSGGSDGNNPYGTVVQGSDGYFYGTTAEGGASNLGVVFKLSIPLNPPPYPINQITNVQVAATNIIFTIPSIAGETYQLQFSNSMNPANWVNVSGASVTNSIGALLTLTNFGGAVGPQGFYRFAITP